MSEIETTAAFVKRVYEKADPADGYRVLVDSTTGHYVPLAGEAEPAAA